MAKQRKTAAMQRHHDYVGEQGCLVCGGQAELHHVTGYADRPGRFSRDEWLVTPLCPEHHRIDAKAAFPTSVQGLGHRGFFQEYAIDLFDEAMRLRVESVERERDAA